MYENAMNHFRAETVEYHMASRKRFPLVGRFMEKVPLLLYGPDKKAMQIEAEVQESFFP